MLLRLFFPMIACFLFSTSVSAMRDDVLIIVNDNSIDSPQIGEYYAQQRGIDPNNIVHVNVPAGYFINWNEFRGLRDQIIYFMQQKTLVGSSVNPVVCTGGDSIRYCQASMDQLRQYTKIRYIVTTRGLPTRTTVGNSSEPTSVDNYLRFWLVNYYSEDTSFSTTPRATAFSDGRGMREIIPQIDRELIIGRIDGINLEAALSIIDRTLEAEKNGLYGKLYSTNERATQLWRNHESRKLIYGTSSTAWRYELGLFDESRPECIDYLDLPVKTNKVPDHCKVSISDNRLPGDANGRSPIVSDGLLYIGNLDGQATGNGNFLNLLNWRKDSVCNVTLCEDAADPTACRAASSDVMREINTECVGVAEGFMGYNHQSWPVSYLTIWPTAWRGRNTGDIDHLAFPEVRDDEGYDDNNSVWFRNTDQRSNPKCNTTDDVGAPPLIDCPDEGKVIVYQDIDIPPTQIDANDPQQYLFSLYYKAASLLQQVDLRVRISLREATSKTYVSYGGIQPLAVIPAGDAEWTPVSFSFAVDPSLHTQSDLLYDRLQIEIFTTNNFAGALGLDNISLKQAGIETELVANGSFTDGHKSVSNGDYAANYLSRLNGLAFWGSLSHHKSGGFSFSPHAMEALIYFMRGLPLGDSVWFADTANSGILYGDPVYSPMSIKLNYLTNANDRISTDRIELSGFAINGRDHARVLTNYQIDYCPGDDFFKCDQQQSWKSTERNGSGGIEAGQIFGDWDVTNLPYGDYTLRLKVTSNNAVLGRSQSFHDFYTVKNRYSTDEIPTYRISGKILDEYGEPIPNVSISVNEANGFASTVTTDIEGIYSQEGLTNGVYAVNPYKTGYNINPNTGNILVEVKDTHELKNFTASHQNFTISGHISDKNGQPVPDTEVEIVSADGTSLFTRTNTNGLYSSAGMGNGQYAVLATKIGYSISPMQGNVLLNVDNADITKDFSAVPENYSIKGFVYDEQGNPVPNASMSLFDNASLSSTVFTNANGYYEHAGVSNGTYAISGIKTGYTLNQNFSNTLYTVNNGDSPPMNFTAVPIQQTYFIAGFILQDNQPLAGITVQLIDNQNNIFEIATDNTGFYKFTELENGLYVINPTNENYQFTSLKGNLSQWIADSDVIDKNFAATPN